MGFNMGEPEDFALLVEVCTLSTTLNLHDLHMLHILTRLISGPKGLRADIGSLKRFRIIDS
jgi:hypothetical protein